MEYNLKNTESVCCTPETNTTGVNQPHFNIIRVVC